MKTEPKSTFGAAGPRYPGGLPGQMTTGFSRLRQRSQGGFYGLVGMLGALGGLVLGRAAVGLAQLFIDLPPRLASAALTGLGSALFSSVLGTSIYIAMRRHQRQQVHWIGVSTLAVASLIAGALAGSMLQALYNGLRDPAVDNTGDATAIVVVAASVLIAVLLGILLSRSIPNLPATRGLIAGTFAGLVSLLITGVAIAMGVSAGIACFIGLIALGGTLGYGLSIAETRFREAILEVDWTPEYKTYVGLGSTPVSIGGGRDHIFIPGAPPRISTICVSNNGHVEHVETVSGKRTTLQDGNRLRINGLTMVVRARNRPAASGAKSGEKR